METWKLLLGIALGELDDSAEAVVKEDGLEVKSEEGELRV